MAIRGDSVSAPWRTVEVGAGSDRVIDVRPAFFRLRVFSTELDGREHRDVALRQTGFLGELLQTWWNLRVPFGQKPPTHQVRHRHAESFGDGIERLAGRSPRFVLFVLKRRQIALADSRPFGELVQTHANLVAVGADIGTDGLLLRLRHVLLVHLCPTKEREHSLPHVALLIDEWIRLGDEVTGSKVLAEQLDVRETLVDDLALENGGQ